MKKIIFSTLAFITIGFSSLLIAQPSFAVTGSDFKAGHIIDDAVFYNEGALDASSIQNFLNTQVPTCDTNGTRPAAEFGRSDINRAQYAALKGWQSPPYTCLKNYTQNIPQMEAASGYCNAIPAATNQSGAQIINSVAKACHISPQVLLVLLQKEQSLVLDTWPLNKQYTNATGFACPDTAPCDPAYGGFFYQVYYAARQFQVYKARPNSYNYVAGRTNNIYYNPNLSACGSSPVYIENQATAALYIYTPYQPNSAALNNLYGTGDGCSSYGNRNFWRLFSDWFGSTYSATYEARFDSQSAFEEPFYPGESRTVFIQYKNTGTARWYDDASVPTGSNPVHFAASVPTNRSSAFSYGWSSAGRPNTTFTRVYEANGTTLATNQHVVEPGQIARFEFSITPPANINLGTHREYFQPVLENAQNWNMGGVAWLDLNVASRYQASFQSQSSFPTIKRNSDVTQSFIQYKNTGSAAWYDTTSVPNGYFPAKLVAAGPVGRASQLGASWPSASIAADSFAKVYESNGATLAANQHIVMPGQIARFEFKFGAGANTNTGLYREYLQPRLAGSNYPDMGGLSWMDVTVTPSEYKTSFYSQSAFPTIARGQSSAAFIQYKNTGTAKWYDDSSVPAGFNPIHLAASAPTNRQSVFSYGWLSAGRPNFTFSKVYEADGTTLATDQHTVEPGQIARFEFNVTAPWNVNTGMHREYFQPVLEWANDWNLGGVAWLDIKVTP